jgi:predicted CxxxxCH...CXXCH cytochrome family protein
VTVATHVDGTVQRTVTTGCTQCHGDITASGVASTDSRAAPGFNLAAVDTRGNTSTQKSARGVGTHQAHLTGTTWRSAPIPCASCHVVPANGDVTHAASANATVTFSGLAVTGGATAAINVAGSSVSCSNTYCHGNFTGGARATLNWNPSGTVTCGTCHAIPPAVIAGGSSHPANNACGTCHGGAYSSTTVDPALHMNGVIDGGGEPATGQTSCAGCHGATFAGMDFQTSAKVSKHGLGLDVPSDTGGPSWTGNLATAVPAANRSCVNMCHGDHPHDLVSPAVATHQNNVLLDASTAATRAVGAGGTAQTRTSATRAATDFSASGTGGLCVSCHQNPVDANRPAVGQAAFASAAHNFTAASGSTWTFTLHDGGAFARNCTKCHASRAEGTTPAATTFQAVHFSDDRFLLSGSLNPAGTAAGFVCYNCHGSTASPAAGAQGNRSGKDIQSQIAHATTAGQSGHPSVSDAVHDSVAEFNAAAFGNTLGGKARHASCLDCHDTHEARPTGAGRTVGSATTGNAAGPALQGAWGVRFTGTLAAFATPTAANFTKTTIVAGTDLEATLCFKCHSAFYGTLPNAPSSSPAFQETDQVKEFNPANAGFHPVLATNSATLGSTGNIKAPFTRTSLMTCTDCHESDVTTDPNGPHGSAARFLLKGPNTTWNNTIAVSGSTGMPAGTFCINCHNQNFSGGRFTNHTNGRHNIACMNCHAAIPHGGPRMGILVAPAGAAAAAGTFPGPVANWDTTAPYSNPGSGSRLYLKSYPTATGAWAQSNCGCGGTGH